MSDATDRGSAPANQSDQSSPVEMQLSAQAEWFALVPEPAGFESLCGGRAG